MNDNEHAEKLVEAVTATLELLKRTPMEDIASVIRDGALKADIDRAIKARESWSKIFCLIADDLERNHNRIEEMVRKTQGLKTALHPFASWYNSTLLPAARQIQDLCTALDRLEEHRKSGLLDIIKPLTNKESHP